LEEIYVIVLFMKQGLLSFYGLPLSHTLVEVTVEAPVSLPEGILFEFQTLPVRMTSVQIKKNNNWVFGI